eukprot:3157644-Rhodomonas_salina.2
MKRGGTDESHNGTNERETVEGRQEKKGGLSASTAISAPIVSPQRFVPGILPASRPASSSLSSSGVSASHDWPRN